MTTLAALIAMSTLAFAGPRVTTAGVKPQPTPNPALDAPTLSCGTHTPVSITITVTAGKSGAPGRVFRAVDDIGGLPSERWRLAYERNSLL